MATIRLIPSTYAVSSTTYLSVSNPTNMYTNTDSTTYATVTNSQTGTTSYYLYIRGFNFDDIPSNAIINDWRVLLKANQSGVSTSSSYAPKLCHGTSQITSTMSALSTTVTTREFTDVSESWQNIVEYGSDFGIRINCRRSSRNTTSYVYVYGAQIQVDYTLPDPATVTSTLTGNGTINPSGVTNTYKDQQYTITITPTDNSDPVTLTLDGVEQTITAHYSNSQTTTQSPSSTFTTGFSDSDAQFYMSSSQTGTDYFEQAIGYTAESPYGTGSNNTYVKDGNNNTAYGWFNYHFDFSSIPSNATIENVEVRLYGARENSTIDSTHMARFGCYSGSTLKGQEQDFTSTTNSIVTVTDPGQWTRAQLQDAQVRFYVAYYGGHVNGISFQVTYSIPSGYPDYYTYTFTVTQSAHTINVTIGKISSVLWIKTSTNTWTALTDVFAWKKTSANTWEQVNLDNAFDQNTNYIKGN